MGVDGVLAHLQGDPLFDAAVGVDVSQTDAIVIFQTKIGSITNSVGLTD